jgi:predicted RecA/RadA family phage recombinase
MATNLYAQGKVIQAKNGSGADVASGAPLIIGAGGLVGFCIQSIANDATGSVQLEGIFNWPVKGHNGSANAAVAVGAKVYYTATEAFADTDATATLLGYALGAVESGATTTVPVLLARA